jgi:DNA-binding NarL/FixJ family response regulator
MQASLSGVLIVSDVRLFREGLAAFLAEDSRLGAVAACADSASALEALDATNFAAVCVDCGMDRAPQLTRLLIAKKVNVVLLGMKNDTHAVIDCLEAGIAGYVCKDASVDDLIRVLRSVVNHEVVCSREVAKMLHRRVSATLSQRADASQTDLTSREQEVSRLLEWGWSNKRIAGHLNISVSTTKNHVHNILEKLCVGSRAEAAAMLRRGGASPATSEFSEALN